MVWCGIDLSRSSPVPLFRPPQPAHQVWVAKLQVCTSLLELCRCGQADGINLFVPCFCLSIVWQGSFTTQASTLHPLWPSRHLCPCHVTILLMRVGKRLMAVWVAGSSGVKVQLSPPTSSNKSGFVPPPHLTPNPSTIPRLELPRRCFCLGLRVVVLGQQMCGVFFRSNK